MLPDTVASENPNEARQRRSRMRRTPSDKRIELTERDIAVFQLLGRYRFLRSTQLHAFVGGKSQKRFIERLGHLYHEGGYLNRPEQQWQAFNARYMPVVYELSETGVALIHQLGLGTAASRPSERARVIRQYHHELMVCDILSAIELGLRDLPNVRFVSWQEILKNPKFPESTRNVSNPLAVPVSVSYADPRTKKVSSSERPLIPDALFGIEYAEANRKQYRFFALEADRNTEPVIRGNLEQSSYLRKMLQYREIAAKAIYRTWWGLPNLLTLNVTISLEHMQNLMRLGDELTNGKGCSYLLFKTVSTFGASEKIAEPPHDILAGWYRIGHAAFDLAASA